MASDSPELSLQDQLLALLFVAPGPLTPQRLAEATERPAAEITATLTDLAAHLTGGIRLEMLRDEYRLVSAPAAANVIRRFLQTESKAELTRPALETLAIIAYRGPLTKSAIEQLRGVSSDTIIRNLLARGLIIETGKAAEPGRPVLYGVSHSFLQHFGLTSPADLPPMPAADTEGEATEATAPAGTMAIPPEPSHED